VYITLFLKLRVSEAFLNSAISSNLFRRALCFHSCRACRGRINSHHHSMCLPLYEIIHVCLKPFKLRFWDIRPEALEALGPDLWKRSINGTFSGLLAP
jgi:hypothetical protein